jgi:hypothetical protein
VCTVIASQTIFTAQVANAETGPIQSIGNNTNPDFQLEQSATNVTSSDLLPYVNRMHGILMSFPSNWTLSTSGLPDYTQIVGFYSPLQNLSDSIPARLSISVMNYQQNVSLKDFTKLTLTSLNRTGQFKVISSDPVTLAGRPGYQIILSTLPNLGNPLNFGLMQSWTAVGTKIYQFSYSTESSKFATYLPTVELMLKSLRIHDTR